MAQVYDFSRPGEPPEDRPEADPMRDKVAEALSRMLYDRRAFFGIENLHHTVEESGVIPENFSMRQRVVPHKCQAEPLAAVFRIRLAEQGLSMKSGRDRALGRVLFRILNANQTDVRSIADALYGRLRRSLESKDLSA